MACVLALSVTTLAPSPAPRPPVHLYAQGIARGDDGRPVLVPVAARARHVEGTSRLETGSTPLDGLAAPDAAGLAEDRAWLAAGSVPGEETRWADMSRRALLDLDLLVLDDGAAAAGWNANWRYVWPRDAAFVAVALSLTGRHEQAFRILEHVQSLQEDDGTWHARYLLDGSGDVPDDRGTQLDGLGWMLWATWVWSRTTPESATGLASLAPMVTAASRALRENLDTGLRLPLPSPDYWEVPESEVTLGTAAPILVGARAAVDLLGDLGRSDASARAVERDLTDGVAAHFGRRGYPRTASGRLMDTSVAFLMPPFAPSDDGVETAWRHALDVLARPNGGLAPGEGWKSDGVAWTPETAVFAMTAAASGDVATATRLLDWLDDHRTSLGSLPEKVNHLGEPAAVAPLAWTAAGTLITLALLDGAELPVPGER